MASASKLLISCHCGVAKQIVSLRGPSSGGALAPRDINLCHCAACRHNTGLLCVSHTWVERPGTVDGLVEYRSATKGVSRFFCRGCGCQVFWRKEEEDDDGDGDVGVGGKEMWAVATGVIVGFCGGQGEELDEGDRGRGVLRYARHIHTEGTKDGGATIFMKQMEVVHEGEEYEGLEDLEGSERDKEGKGRREKEEEVLNAFCYCGRVRFHITRPNSESRLPRSNFPDLMIPYHTKSPDIQNPDDEKWWLRPGIDARARGSEEKEAGPRRYLAGTCACRSCRLTSGYEIQTWAFIPRANIFLHIRDDNNEQEEGTTTTSTSDPSQAKTIVPLNFTALPPGLLTSYESSEGVSREFCAGCGATVFWRDRWRPELIDVGAGLFDADEGARAETWLDWWTGRVSFAEDAGNGREGAVAELAVGLIKGLEGGLRMWEGERPERV